MFDLPKIIVSQYTKGNADNLNDLIDKYIFLDTVVFKGERLKTESILDIKTHYKPTETFRYAHLNSCHHPALKMVSLTAKQ